MPEHLQHPERHWHPGAAPPRAPRPSPILILLPVCLGWPSLDISPKEDHRMGSQAAALLVYLPEVPHAPTFSWFFLRSFYIVETNVVTISYLEIAPRNGLRERSESPGRGASGLGCLLLSAGHKVETERRENGGMRMTEAGLRGCSCQTRGRKRVGRPGAGRGCSCPSSASSPSPFTAASAPELWV